MAKKNKNSQDINDKVDDIELVSVEKYAKLRNVHRRAVQYQIEQGNLAPAISYDEKSRKLINPKIANEIWPLRTDNYNAKRKSEISDDEIEEHYVDPKDFLGDPSIPEISQSRKIREHYEAQLAKTKYEKELGRLIDAEEVKTSAFKLGRQVRDSILNIPSRVSAELAAESDPFKVEKKLNDELRKALQSLGVMK